MEIKNIFLKDLGIDMGNPMIQVEHCPEIDDARIFEVEFKDNWENAMTLDITGHGILYNDTIITIPVSYE